MIRELIALTVGVLKFDSTVFNTHIESKDALKRGLLLIIAVTLLSGFFPFLSSLVVSVQPVNWDALQQQMQQSLDAQSQFNLSLRVPQVRAMADQMIREILATAKDVTALPPNIGFLPQGLQRVLAVLGHWLSQPLVSIAAWLSYAVWVMLLVKLLGGQASLSRQLGATTLAFAPHVFNIFTGLLSLAGTLPVAGPCIGGINFFLVLGIDVWSIAVYVKATATANGFGAGKATLAVILPWVLEVFVLSLFFIVLLIGFIVAVAGKG